MRQRNYGCRITEELVYSQYRAIMLENEKLQIILLLDRGGEPVRWLHKPTDVDFIWKTRQGLQPPHGLYPDYQMMYLGGWQEMMPEVSDTHTYRGAVVHRGETAINPWNYTITRNEPEEIRVRLNHQLRSLPLYIEKELIMKSGETSVRIEETVHNEASVPMETNWGHHLAYGAPFLTEASRITFTPGANILYSDLMKSSPWPTIDQHGQRIDLSRMPPAGTRRELMAIEPIDGTYRILNPDRRLTLDVRWDHQVWPYVWYWQNFAADADAPFFASEYNIGLEMFNVLPKLTLAEAAAQGKAIQLAPHAALTSWLEFEVKEEME